jgi:hypothetical protein
VRDVVRGLDVFGDDRDAQMVAQRRRDEDVGGVCLVSTVDREIT